MDGDRLPTARPVRRPRPARTSRVGRWARAALVAVAAALAVVFALAWRIDPYGPDGTPKRMSTHTQLGLPACNFVEWTGRPCPSCGMSTSFALLVRGDVGASLRANWVGTLLALTWAGVLVWAVLSGLAGRLLFVRPGRGELVLTAAVGVFVVLMLGRWAGVLLQ
ncbi:MAG: DUF2752 domain-containing protein [Gemmataceae bacterium]|nr:DUF2752 domain-containing protein [Gemmataceae bacterium]